MKNFLPIILFFCLCIKTFSQTSSLEDARKSILNRNCLKGLEQLENIKSESDSIIYYKVIACNCLKDSSLEYTIDLEKNIKIFYQNVRKSSFPDIFYNNVIKIETEHIKFKKNDSLFFKNKQALYKKEETISGNQDVLNDITTYLKSTKNTYFSDSLKNTILNINEKIVSIIAKEKIISKKKSTKNFETLLEKKMF